MYKCYECGLSLLKILDRCPNCESIEQNRIALEQNRNAVIVSGIANIKAIKLKMEMDLRIANEQNITLEEARKKGYDLFGIEEPTTFHNSIDETGKIIGCNFKNPFILDNLKKEYSYGFYQRLSDETSKTILEEKNIREIFTKQAYKLGRENFKGEYFFTSEDYDFFTFTTKTYTVHPYLILYNSDKKIYELGRLDWLEFKEDYLRDAYIAGALEFIKENNTPLKVNERIIAENKKIQEQIEAEKNKLIEEQKAKEQERKEWILALSVFGVGLLLFGIFLYLIWGTFWFWVIVIIIICIPLYMLRIL